MSKFTNNKYFLVPKKAAESRVVDMLLEEEEWAVVDNTFKITPEPVTSTKIVENLITTSPLFSKKQQEELFSEKSKKIYQAHGDETENVRLEDTFCLS